MIFLLSSLMFPLDFWSTYPELLFLISVWTYTHPELKRKKRKKHNMSKKYYLYYLLFQNKCYSDLVGQWYIFPVFIFLNGFGVSYLRSSGLRLIRQLARPCWLCVQGGSGVWLEIWDSLTDWVFSFFQLWAFGVAGWTVLFTGHIPDQRRDWRMIIF